jgi:predicted GNAT family acetyltransferase
MGDIQFKLDSNGKGGFFLEENGERLAFMEIGMKDNDIIVFHTEVSEKLKGKGVGTSLIAALVDYARKNKYRIVALCPFVLAHFKRHPALYEDVWNQNWKKN